MKKILLAIVILSTLSLSARAEYVQGYTRRDGTYVQGYYRSDRSGTATDNYSYQGNKNPYNGSTGANRYQHDVTSPYFNGTPNSNGGYGHGNYNRYGR